MADIRDTKPADEKTPDARPAPPHDGAPAETDRADAPAPSDPPPDPPSDSPAEATPAPQPERRSLWARLKGRRQRNPLFIEFEPDALEIEHRDPRPLTRYTLYTLAALLVCVVVWATVSEVDVVVSAEGKLATTAATIVVQPLETSVVRDVRVREGDIVRAGDLLATLDPTFTQADVAELRSAMSSFAAQVARLTAEVVGEPYGTSDAPSSDELLQRSIFDQRREGYAAQMQSYAARQAELEARLQGARDAVGSLAERHKVLIEVEAMRQELLDRKSGSRLTVLEARNDRLMVERELEQMRDTVVETTHQIDALEGEREAFIRDWRAKAAAELVDAEREYSRARERLAKAERRRELVNLRAPRDAVVLEIAQRSVGSVAREAEPLFTLVPLDVPLQVEANVRAADIGHLKVGDPVRVKLQAYPFQKYGTLDGEVRTISEDAFNPQAAQRGHGAGGGGEGAAGTAVYRVAIDLTRTTLDRQPENYRLIPGMTTIAEIKVGKRTVASYFLYPLLRGLDESIREP